MHFKPSEMVHGEYVKELFSSPLSNLVGELVQAFCERKVQNQKISIVNASRLSTQVLIVITKNLAVC